MTAAPRELTALDYHTEGEPMRFIIDGVPPIPGASLMDGAYAPGLSG